MRHDPALLIGAVARRAGVSVPAIRHYEDLGLVMSERDRSGRRRFARSQIRRLSFILIAQRLGLSLGEIGELLARLPQKRTPTAEDWRKIAEDIGSRIDAQINQLERMQARLQGCIGCGCLSLEACHIYNSNDRMGKAGPGPRRLY